MICPVVAAQMKDGVPIIDRGRRIGCGVCAPACPTNAVVFEVREDKIEVKPASTFRELHH
ncbi:MAG: 4Fe-4S binding protein [Deltaproteobacteria bacterium]|nr:4Fe-4S binding protein [Deltaproteobacteria bacterium]